MSGHILFLAHRLPFPPDRGDKIRSHHVLKALAELGPVHVGCLAESEADYAHEYQLAAIAASYTMPPRRKSLLVSGLSALRRQEPVSCAAFRSDEMAHWVRQTLANYPVDTIYVFSGQMGQYVPDEFSGRLVVDLVDVDSAKFEQYARDARFPMRLVHGREAHLLHRIECDLSSRADVTLLVSQEEAELLRERIGPGIGNIRALGNGIDCTAFDPATVQPARELLRAGPHITFTGQMDYPPNIGAAERFATSILPAIRQRFTSALFHIVGRAPTDAVQALGNLPGVLVHGEVADIRAFLAGSDIVTAPLLLARGVQNKVLEAMAMARAVVLSAEAARGIPAIDGEHFAVGSRDHELIERAIALLGDKTARNTMGRAARDFVESQMRWEAQLADLPAIMGGGLRVREKRDAA